MNPKQILNVAYWVAVLIGVTICVGQKKETIIILCCMLVGLIVLSLISLYLEGTRENGELVVKDERGKLHAIVNDNLKRGTPSVQLHQDMLRELAQCIEREKQLRESARRVYNALGMLMADSAAFISKNPGDPRLADLRRRSKYAEGVLDKNKHLK